MMSLFIALLGTHNFAVVRGSAMSIQVIKYIYHSMLIPPAAGVSGVIAKFFSVQLVHLVNF